MSAMDSQAIDRFLEQEIAADHIPGAVLYVAHQGRSLLHRAYGNRVVHPAAAPMQTDTVFDLASLTKVVATLPAALKLMEQGRISLSDPVHTFLPQFSRKEGEPIRILHLLTHTSGLAADLPDARTTLQLSAEQIRQHVLEQAPLHPPGIKVVYSDLGMIVMHLVIERVTGESFDTYVKREIHEPLNMNETVFCPAFHPSRYAATEFCKERNDWKTGVVHDEKAERLGGISGHAGLFSTANDLAQYACMIRQGGVLNGRQILSAASVRLSQRNFTPYDSEHRGLGWLLKHPANSSPAGDYVSEQAFGHTGFTGTSIWFDPAVDLQVILLTNRVHFGRADHILRLRPRLHNLIRAQLD